MIISMFLAESLRSTRLRGSSVAARCPRGLAAGRPHVPHLGHLPLTGVATSWSCRRGTFSSGYLGRPYRRRAFGQARVVRRTGRNCAAEPPRAGLDACTTSAPPPRLHGRRTADGAAVGCALFGFDPRYVAGTNRRGVFRGERSGGAGTRPRSGGMPLRGQGYSRRRPLVGRVIARPCARSRRPPARSIPSGSIW